MHQKRRKPPGFLRFCYTKDEVLNMCDLLFKSALTYNDLLDMKFHITIAHKRKLLEIVLCFPVENYYHLAGFQYAGINQLNNGKEALSKVLNRNVSESHLIAAGVYEKIINRIESIALLPKLLNEGRVVFHYRGHEQPWSDIEADYIAYFELEETAVLLFTAGENPESQSPVSIFQRNDDHYIKYCPRYKVLQIVQERISTNESELLFRSPSYRMDS